MTMALGCVLVQLPRVTSRQIVCHRHRRTKYYEMPTVIYGLGLTGVTC